MTKDVENTSESFLSRWAKRKADVRAEESNSVEMQNINPNIGVPFEAKMPVTAIPERGLISNANENAETNPRLPTIESLTQESDFSPFMGKEVAADLRNQAMKKLFTDPHYNVQDGLDIYIGDYTKSDPIPLEMLRKMTQSKALFLFEEEEKAEAEAAAALAAAGSADVSAITSGGEPAIEVESIAENEVEPHPQLTPTDVTDAIIKSK
jgi:hypothetical protein